MQESETELLSSTGIEDNRRKRNADSKKRGRKRKNRRTDKKRTNSFNGPQEVETSTATRKTTSPID